MRKIVGQSTPPLFALARRSFCPRSKWSTKGDSEAYSTFRPNYPVDLLQQMNQILDDAKCKRKFAVDIGCGNGQITGALARNSPSDPYSKKCEVSDYGLEFSSVLGIDLSPTQIESAVKLANIQYRVSDLNAERLQDFFEREKTFSDKPDCIVFAQSLHWFDIVSMMADSYDIMQPDSSVVFICGYTTPHSLGSEPFQSCFRRFYIDVLGSQKAPEDDQCLWDIDRRVIDSSFDAYTDIFVDQFGGDKSKLVKSTYGEVKWMTDRDWFGYMDTMSAVKELKKRDESLYQSEKRKLELAFNDTIRAQHRNKMLVVFPFFLVACVK